MSEPGEPGAEPGDPGAELSGQLLVATPGLVDPNFARTVVLVLHHDRTGSLGLVLSRPSQLHLDEPLARWAHLAAAPKVVFVGGPVASAVAICVARVRVLHGSDLPQGWRPVRGRVGTLDLHGDPASAATSVEALRVFGGYAGWGPGQLPMELGLGGWLVVEPQEDDAFSSDPAGLWKSVLRRQGGGLAILASYPEDPSAN